MSTCSIIITQPFFSLYKQPKLIQILKINELGHARHTFSSNYNVHKSLCGLCFWAPDPFLDAGEVESYELKA